MNNEMTRSEYMLDLTHRLQEALKHDLYFAHALYEQSTKAETDILESLIGMANGRRSEDMGDEGQKTLKHLKRTDRSHGGDKDTTMARRLYKIHPRGLTEPA